MKNYVMIKVTNYLKLVSIMTTQDVLDFILEICPPTGNMMEAIAINTAEVLK